jgi:hypothetical protein
VRSASIVATEHRKELLDHGAGAQNDAELAVVLEGLA